MRLYSAYRHSLILLIVLGIISASSFASDQSNGRILLTVSGAIDATNQEQERTFDLATLGNLPQYTIATHNPWTKGLHIYRGFSAVDLLQEVGSSGSLLQVTALNDYMTELPLSDFIDNGAIFATHQDGKPMSVRNLGPIMVIYPFDERHELKSELFYGRSIWQIHHIKVLAATEQ